MANIRMNEPINSRSSFIKRVSFVLNGFVHRKFAIYQEFPCISLRIIIPRGGILSAARE